ncbi:hypothetical protein ACHAXA_003377 [Cyclostephanos tholiformis]|uniref:Aminotransferase class I/classII large domain-containing protein n=1 Tax=Cyclostephanos tholiformis TaxID=382380 RepID=A0ABD3RAR6_9STRA
MTIGFASGCHSIVFAPGYQSTVQSPKWIIGNEGVTVIPNDWQVDVTKLRDAIRRNTKFLILNEPHNPGGIVMSRNIVILCDEVYRLLEHAGNIRLPTMASSYEKGISVVAMSKPWGGCGIKINIGWIACRDRDMVRRMIDVQYFGCACVSCASKIQARMVLAVSETMLRERMNIILDNKSKLINFIENKHGKWFEWRRPNAGAIAFVKFKGPWTSDVLGKHLARAGISIKPAYCFVDDTTVAPTSEEVSKYFRIGYGEKEIASALEALGEFVRAHESSWQEALPSTRETPVCSL